MSELNDILLGSLNATLVSTVSTVKHLYNTVPGARVVLLYIKNSYQNDPFRSFLELLLVIFIVFYLLHKRYRINNTDVKLDPKVVEELIAEWEPEPLTKPISQAGKELLESLPVICSPVDTHVMVEGVSGEVVHFSSYNFLDMASRKETKDKVLAGLRRYGVGSCGPPGFYGTLDVHLELEKDLAEFLQVEAAIIYSQGFSTISSTIPAFSKRGDVIVADESVSFSVQKGIQLSRSNSHFFKHNDLGHLVEILEQIEADRIKKKRQLTRRFIVVEGLYSKTGDLCDLPKLIEIKKKYKYRLIVEEALSFGVLGANGRGISEHFGIPAKEIDVITASMANSLAGSGGFCAGSTVVVDHQRLSGAAYCYSASLPAVLAISARENLSALRTEPYRLSNLRKNVALFRSLLRELKDGDLALEPIGDAESPMIHFRLRNSTQPRENQDRILRKISGELLKEHLLVSPAAYVEEQETQIPSPSLRVCISGGHTEAELRKLVDSLVSASKHAL